MTEYQYTLTISEPTTFSLNGQDVQGHVVTENTSTTPVVFFVLSSSSVGNDDIQHFQSVIMDSRFKFFEHVPMMSIQHTWRSIPSISIFSFSDINYCPTSQPTPLTVFRYATIRQDSPPKKGYYLWTYTKNGTYSVHTKVLTNNPNVYPSQTYTCQDVYATAVPDYSWIPDDTNFSIAFSGESDPTTAVTLSQTIYQYLKGQKYISLGGGRTQWTTPMITTITSAIIDNIFSAYDGICWDIENLVFSNDVENAFLTAFQTAREHDLINFITISHTAPFGVAAANTAAVMNWFFQCPYVDTISPQLYTCDFGTASEYDSTSGFLWTSPTSTVDTFQSLYQKRSNPALEIIPSIFSNISTNGCFDLYLTGGTNDGSFPIDFYGSYLPPQFTTDYGVYYFFHTILGIPTTGSVQFINGSLQLDSTTYICDNNPHCHET